jgi:transposase
MTGRRTIKRIFLAAGSTDMRKSINGLSFLVEQAMALDLFTGDFSVFCNRRRNMIKILYWDHNGFTLSHKRMGKHRFHWPSSTEQVVTIGEKQLEWVSKAVVILDQLEIVKPCPH